MLMVLVRDQRQDRVCVRKSEEIAVENSVSKPSVESIHTSSNPVAGD